MTSPIRRRISGADPLTVAALLSILFCTVAGVAPHGLMAQDVIREGREHGVEPPREILQMLEQDPTAFEFKRAWRQKVRRIRDVRRAMEARVGPELAAPQLAQGGAALTGTLGVSVAMGLYSDATALYTAAEYQAKLYGDGLYTVKTFYEEMSRGVFEVDGTVPGWVTLPNPAWYYEPSDSTDATFGRTGEFLQHTLDGLDPTVDFGQYDNDGPDGYPNSGDDDGYVDVVAFLYQAAPKSCGGPGIWPHRWYYGAYWGSPYTTNDERLGGGFIVVDDYMIQAGVGCDGTSLMEIGTFSHELGHAINLPDLYDTNSSNGDSEGIGEWGLMGSGNWNMQYSPAHMSAWSKDYLGWLSVETVTASAAGVVLEPVYETGRVLRYDIPTTEEYFLLEHRQDTLSDQYINGPGLLIWIEPGGRGRSVSRHEWADGVRSGDVSGERFE